MFHWPELLPHNQDRTEVRILSAALTGFFAWYMLEPALYAWDVQASLLFKLVVLTGHPTAMLCIFLGCAAAVVPHIASLLFLPRFLDCRLPRLMATAGTFVACLLWFHLADLSRPLDYGWLPYIFAVRAVLNLLVSAVFAFSLNSQQLREMLHVSQPTS